MRGRYDGDSAQAMPPVEFRGGLPFFDELDDWHLWRGRIAEAEADVERQLERRGFVGGRSLSPTPALSPEHEVLAAVVRCELRDERVAARKRAERAAAAALAAEVVTDP